MKRLYIMLFGIIMSMSFIGCNKNVDVSLNGNNNSATMSTAIPEVIVTSADISALPDNVDYIRKRQFKHISKNYTTASILLLALWRI